MENKFKKLCGSINYNTYAALQKTFGISGIGFTLANELIIPQNTLLSSSVNIGAYTLIATYLGLVWSHGINHTKDINQIKKLYYEFIKNYNKLNKVFDLNDPIQVYTMFNCLLYKGYLSKDKEFEFLGKQARDIDSLYGTNVIAGKAVCRHISAMLTDILKDYGIESSQLGVYSKNYSINITVLEQPKYTKDDLVNWVRTHITDEKTYEFVMKLIEELVDKRNQSIEISAEMIDDKNPLKRKVGNHAITFAFKDEKSYFLDPTQARIYRMNESDKNILFDEECDNIPIKTLPSMVLNNSQDYLRMRERLASQYPSVTKEEEMKMIRDTLALCDSNMDIFEQFYTENSELYDDISSKILKIRKGKSILR